MRIYRLGRSRGSVSQILIGTSGFSYPDWKGVVYPKDLKKRGIHELEYVAQFVDFVEINTSFYRPLNPEVAKKWCELAAKANPAFQFTAKLTQVFSHAPGPDKKKSSSAETIRYTPQDVEDAKRGFEPLASERKLGALLLQFPISFRYTEGNWDHLIDVLHLFREYPMAVEVRHETWGDPLVLGALEDEQVAFCNIDQTRIGGTLEGTQYVTASFAYLRLHGRNKQWFQAKDRDERYDYLYSKEKLGRIKEKISNMSAKAKKVFVAANNHPKGQAPANALELKSMLTGKRVKAPEILVQAYPQELRDITLPESTQLQIWG